MGRVAVIGDGPAGLLAATALSRAGHEVTLFAPPAARTAHHRHVHRIPAATLAAMEAMAGSALDGWEIGPLLFAMGGRTETLPPQPVVDIAKLLASLRVRADAAGVKRYSINGRKAVSAKSGLWHAGESDGAYTHLIDASGAGRSVAGQIAEAHGFAWSVDEIGARDHYRSFSVSTRGLTRPASWAAKAEIAGMPCDIYVACDGEGAAQITLSHSAGFPSPCPLDVMAAFRVAGGGWADRVFAATGQSERAAAFNACAATLLSLDLRDLAQIPPYLPIGDCLVQTRPRLGQGFTQIAAQVELITSGIAANTEDMAALQDALFGHAHAAWAAAAMRDTLPRAA
ncbi:hypothetical protein ACFOWX_01015 [Sphingorhabdus arenilitoris]|uniref:Uncharacterized protein n=1 Tax=Sphingorhabdus arenilitoris TaxID=1490041 RepID=A0ABV8REY4_9SPHN